MDKAASLTLDLQSLALHLDCEGRGNLREAGSLI